jgi:mannose-1-phosphate guanylyltransferase
LYIWLDLLEKEGVDEVMINTHYFAEKVEEAVKKRKNRIKVKLFYEPELLGSGGTVLANEDFVRGEKDFFFIFADNLSNVSLKRIFDFHVIMKSLFTTYVYKTDVPKQKGIFVSDLNGKVVDFEEKPEFPKSNIASAGIGVLSNKVFGEFRVKSLSASADAKNAELRVKSEVIDFGKDVMPKLLNNMYVMETNDYIRDIGTLKDLEEARASIMNYEL